MPYYRAKSGLNVTFCIGDSFYAADGTTEHPAVPAMEADDDYESSSKPFGKAKSSPKPAAKPEAKPAAKAPTAPKLDVIDPDDYTKKVLIAAAKDLGVDDGGTKADIAGRLSEAPGSKAALAKHA